MNETTPLAVADSTAPPLVLVGFPPPELAALARELGPEVSCMTAESPREAIAWYERRGYLILCLGPELTTEEAGSFLAAVSAAVPRDRSCNLVLAADTDLRIFQELVDDERLYYLSPAPMARSEVAALLRSSLELPRKSVAPDADDRLDDVDPEALLRMATALARQSSLAQAAAMLAQQAAEVGGADRARLWIYEPKRDTLWAPRQSGWDESRVSAAVGLVSFTNRTRREVLLDCAEADPRFDADTDGDNPGDRLLALPVGTGSGGFAGVLVLVRQRARPPFSAAECGRLRRLAGIGAPILELLAAQDRHEGWAVRRHGVMGTDLADLFRPAALERQVGAEREPSPMLHLSGQSLRWGYRLLLVLLLGTILVAAFGSVRDYAAGWAVVRKADVPQGSAAWQVVALLPGRYRPLVRPGMPLQLEIQGFRGSTQRLVIQRVWPSVVGPSAARRLLGPDVGDAAPISGLVFLVAAPLPAATFHSASGEYAYHEGMPGVAEVPVHSERILFNLFPSLKLLFGSA